MTNLVFKPYRAHSARSFDRMFNEFFHEMPSLPESACCVAPRVNIEESKDNISLTFEIPGFAKDEIKVTIKEKVLTVSGEREKEEKKEDVNYLVSEIKTGSFQRSFTLPRTVDTESVKADHKNGMLIVTLAKVPEAKPKEIEVSVA